MTIWRPGLTVGQPNLQNQRDRKNVYIRGFLSVKRYLDLAKYESIPWIIAKRTCEAHVSNFGGLAGSEDLACATLPTTPLDFQCKV